MSQDSQSLKAKNPSKQGQMKRYLHDMFCSDCNCPYCGPFKTVQRTKE